MMESEDKSIYGEEDKYWDKSGVMMSKGNSELVLKSLGRSTETEIK